MPYAWNKKQSRNAVVLIELDTKFIDTLEADENGCQFVAWDKDENRYLVQVANLTLGTLKAFVDKVRSTEDH